jgi:hypothetical protein
VDRSHIITTATGAVALAVAAPVVISMASLISFAWPVIPILTVGSVWAAVNRKETSQNQHDNNKDKKTSAYHSAKNRDCTEPQASYARRKSPAGMLG